MNVIFLTTCRIRDIKVSGIYTDLMRKFRDQGHLVHIVVPVERQFGQPTHLRESDGVKILSVKTLNIQKTNIIEKGIGTVLLERQFISAIRDYLNDVHFDLILYSTPPITFNGVVSFLKRNNPGAISYLLLKDIFPQNAVDLGMFSRKSIIYRYFRHKEVCLYKISDFIGCMSPANVEYVLKHNVFLNASKVEIAPNSIDLPDNEHSIERNLIRNKYNLPLSVPIFIYGGNLGRPQGIDFLICALEKNKNRTDCHFLIVGNGTEYNKLINWIKQSAPHNITVIPALPSGEYDTLVQSCDVGMIFLDYRFTIPNYPSRLLSYMRFHMPVLVATDTNTDVGKIAEQNHYGIWCESRNPDDFTACVDKIVANPQKMKEMGERGYEFFCDNYRIDNTYDAITKHIRANLQMKSKE